MRGVRTPELGAAGAFVSWASSRAMVVAVVVVECDGCGCIDGRWCFVRI